MYPMNRSHPASVKDGRKSGQQSILKMLPLMLFILALAYLAFLYGFIAGVYRLPPYDFFRTAYDGMEDLRKHWKNDLNIEPTRLLVPAAPDGPEMSTFTQARMAEGRRLISGLTHGRDSLYGVVLLDRDNKELHYWPVNYQQLDPAGADPENVFLHGVEPMPDGSMIVNFDDGNVLARIGACGEILWIEPGRFHHAVSRGYDGTIWTLEDVRGSRDQLIVQLDDDGRVLRRISLLDDIVVPNQLHGLFYIKTSMDRDEIQLDRDPFHLNDVEVLDSEKAQVFPSFHTGDLLLSFRELNLIAVLDGNDYTLKWWQIGPWYRQHDPDFLDDGTISVYNNNTGFRNSEILTVNPESRAIKTLFRGDENTPFYSWRRGKHQHLRNDNILITESEAGRVLEVDARGDVVWEHRNIFDESRNGLISDAVQVPADFFRRDALTCE